jgi:hypothetical protein
MLPTELLHRIFDQLDTQDIVFSFRIRNVCKQFYTITKSYNRYKIAVSGISTKADIYKIYRYIPLENVASMFVYIPYYEGVDLETISTPRRYSDSDILSQTLIRNRIK